MYICPKCGASVSENYEACLRCGTPVSSSDSLSSERFNTIIKLENYKKLLTETEDLKARIKPQNTFPASDARNYKSRSFIKYFWPCLITAPVLGVITYVGGVVLAVLSIDLNAPVETKNEAVSIVMAPFFMLLLGVLIAAAIIIIGIIISKRKQNAFNSNAELMNRQVSEKYKQGLENQRLLDMYQDDIQQMYKYTSLVPEKYRSADSVGKIIEILKEKKAETVEEACTMIEE